MIEKISVKLLNERAVLPKRSTEGSAGYDLYAACEAPVTVSPGAIALIPTGISVEVPAPYAAFIFARSGLGIKHGVAPANGVGVIDSDYRGEIKVGLTNHSGEPYVISPGERIAQMIFLPCALPELAVAESLTDSQRGEGGFGSTGTK